MTEINEHLDSTKRTLERIEYEERIYSIILALLLMLIHIKLHLRC